jgi:hypothetical protein
MRGGGGGIVDGGWRKLDAWLGRAAILSQAM